MPRRAIHDRRSIHARQCNSCQRQFIVESACQRHDGLYMTGAWEHIDRYDLALDLISVARKFDAVAGKRIGIAGNINDTSDTAPGYIGDQLRCASLSRRIEYHRIGVYLSSEFALGSGKYSAGLRGISAEKFGVFHTVQLCVAPCALHGIGDYLYPRKARRRSCHS